VPENATPSKFYAILLEWHRVGICDERQIVVGLDDAAIFHDFSGLVLSAGELIYEAEMLRTSHADLVDLFKMTIEGYPIPHGEEEALGGRDIFPALKFLLENQRRQIQQGVYLAEVIRECNLFLESLNMWLWDESYLFVTLQGWLPEFGSQLIERELSVFSERKRGLKIPQEEACWFGRLSMLMAQRGPWLGANSYDPLLELIDDFNEMHVAT